MNLDLNCDLGEGAGHDAELLALATTANVCCGAHAGDAAVSLATLRQAASAGVGVGAHPGYPDRENFGRRELAWSSERIFAECIAQVGALQALTQSVGVKLSHIKPHGALYNQACRVENIARPVIDAAEQFKLPLFGLPNSMLERLCAGRVRFIREGFADRGYRSDGSLVPRTDAGAIIHDSNVAAEQADRLVRDHGVQTLCVHGDGPDALRFLRELRSVLIARGYELRSIA